MTPEEKLARVEELLRERDAITEELLELMEAHPDEDADEELEDEEKEPAPKRGEHKCSVCGKPGHSSRTCPKNKPESYSFEGSKSERKPKTFIPKPCCGSQGPRHKGDCPENSPEASKKRGEPMFKSAFERVKIAASHEIPSDVIARNLNLTLNQVNEAILAKDYEGYAAQYE